MKHFITLLSFLLSIQLIAQFEGNTSPDYPSLIKYYQKLASEYKEIELFNMGSSDYGLPIYLCVINGAQDSTATFEKARQGTTLLINNAIHPGEPDGVNACLIWIQKWIKEGKPLKDLPLIGIIPAYNVGGMMNRSSTSRANQNGPEEYGFRGNAQNLDLNRDFIKMDSKNMFTFAKIYHALDPDVFLDTHVSNGADYQYTMTYIASVRERMAPSLASLMHDNMIPYLEKESSAKGFDLIPYVHTKGQTPESGIMVFNDLPRYAMGYASLLNAISFTLETHMLKPFPQRVQSTLIFINAAIDWMKTNSEAIEKARKEAFRWEGEMQYFKYNYNLTDDQDSILFKGFEFSEPVSEVTGLKRLKYHEDKPYTKYIPYYHTYVAKDSILVPEAIILGAQCKEVLQRLDANRVEYNVVNEEKDVNIRACRIENYENGDKPYEGHYLHTKITCDYPPKNIDLKIGDIIVPTQQKNRRFILSVLHPEAPDSYFAWNLYDSHIQQKEYFSPYVFEDKAKELLENDPELKTKFEAKKAEDKEFRESSWEQLYFIYVNSPYYEPTHNFIPVYHSIK